MKQSTGEGPYKVSSSCTTLPPLFYFGMLFFSFVSKLPDSLLNPLRNIILKINQILFQMSTQEETIEPNHPFYSEKINGLRG